MYHQSIVSTRLPCLVWFRSFRWMSLGESPARGLAKALSRQGGDHDTSKMYWLWIVDDCFGLLEWCSTTFHLVFSTSSLDAYGFFISPTTYMGLKAWSGDFLPLSKDQKFWDLPPLQALCWYFTGASSPRTAHTDSVLTYLSWVWLSVAYKQNATKWEVRSGRVVVDSESRFFWHVFRFCLRPMWCPCLQPWACRQTGHARWRRGQLHQSWGYLCSRESYVWHLAKLSWGAPGCIILCFTSHLSERHTA